MSLVLITGCGNRGDTSAQGAEPAIPGEREDPNAAITTGSVDFSGTPGSPNAQVPQIMIDGVKYYLWGDPPRSMDIPEACYSGQVRSTVPISQMPTENDQANFRAEPGTPYARYGDGYSYYAFRVESGGAFGAEGIKSR